VFCVDRDHYLAMFAGISLMIAGFGIAFVIFQIHNGLNGSENLLTVLLSQV